MKHKWYYPTSAKYHNAMSSLIASEVNLPYFLERAMMFGTVCSYDMARHNITLAFTHQSEAIGWASRN